MRPLSLPRSRAGVGTLALVLTAGALSPVLALSPGADPEAAAAKAKARATKVKLTSFDSTAQLRKGTVRGAVVKNGSVTLKAPKSERKMDGQRYKAGAWVSPWVSTSFTELLPSWQASTPNHSVIEVLVRVRDADGTTGSWDRVARWTSQDKGTLKNRPVYARKSWTSQPDDLASVATDTVRVKSSAGAAAWQVKVVLMRRAGTASRPTLHRVGAAATTVVKRTSTSAPGTGVGTVIDVPRYSQMTHAGHYPQFGNGGEAWCSATSLAMVLEHYGVNPAKGHAWAGKKHADGIVDFTASKVYDHRYRGTGNWSFNTAYAGTLLPKTYVTRLPHLRAAEKHITAGTPLIVSVAFKRGELTGAPISSTAGHLMVLVGFTPDGNVVVNDPAAKKNEQVRRLYDRAEFERAWLNGSGGLTYVLED